MSYTDLSSSLASVVQTMQITDRPRQHYIRKSMDKTQSLKSFQVQDQQEIPREIIYIAYVRPLLQYSDSKRQLEAIHTEAARIIVGATKLCSIEKLFTDLE